MTLPPLPLVNGELLISGSFLETLSRCSREAEYYKLWGRISSSKKSGLTFGSHIHSALELHYKLQEFNLSQEEITQRVEQLLQSCFADSPNDSDDFRTLNWASEIYRRFASFAQFESFDLLTYPEARECSYCKGKGFLDTEPEAATAPACPHCNATGHFKVMTEVPFKTHLFDYDTRHSAVLFNQLVPDKTQIPIYLHGYIDLPVRIGHQHFIRDFKTTLMLGETFWQQHKMSLAQKGYCYAFQKTTGIPVDGHIITAIRTAQPPIWMQEGRTNKKGETKKIDDWWKESITEQRFYLAEGELTEWKRDVEELMGKFLFHYARGYFPKETTQCVGKYGACQYYEVCSTYPPEIREAILMSGNYETKQPKKPK